MQDPMGVMVVSPVSPSHPYTPTRFLKDVAEARRSGSPYGKTRSASRVARKANYTATLARETEQRRRQRMQGVRTAISMEEAASALELIQTTSQVAPPPNPIQHLLCPSP